MTTPLADPAPAGLAEPAGLTGSPDLPDPLSDAAVTVSLDLAAVIQGLFEVGMDVAAICGRVSDPEVGDRLQSALDDIDRAVRELRAASFEARRAR